MNDSNWFDRQTGEVVENLKTDLDRGLSGEEARARLAEHGANPAVWSRPNERGLTPLFIAEGYRGGGFKPSRPTMDAVNGIMLLEGLSTEGPRPAIRDIYETPAEPSQQR